MKKQSPNLLGAVVRDYFTDHLPRLRQQGVHERGLLLDAVVQEADVGRGLGAQGVLPYGDCKVTEPPPGASISAP